MVTILLKKISPFFHHFSSVFWKNNYCLLHYLSNFFPPKFTAYCYLSNFFRCYCYCHLSNILCYCRHAWYGAVYFQFFSKNSSNPLLLNWSIFEQAIQIPIRGKNAPLENPFLICHLIWNTFFFEQIYFYRKLSL